MKHLNILVSVAHHCEIWDTTLTPIIPGTQNSAQFQPPFYK